MHHHPHDVANESPARPWRRLTAVVAGILLLAACQSARVNPEVATATGDGAPTTTDEKQASLAANPANASEAPAAQPPCCDVPDLWDRVRAGFRFNLDDDNDRIAAQRNWYLRNPEYLDRVIARASRYLRYIVDACEERDMPMELALLPVVESAFDPLAYSSANAAGPWQFIPSTGRIYGLRQDWWYDGRRDLPESTRAALDYLERLAERFDGDYYKALASYNAGAGTVSRAVTRNVRAGRKTDYWSLKVPKETSAYVPKLIAIAQIVKDPAKYGVRLNPIPDEQRFEIVDVGQQIDLARAAEMANMPLTELYLYNPAFNRWATCPQGPHRLLLPTENAGLFRAALVQTPADDRVRYVQHDVVAGETVDSIAVFYQVPAAAVRAVNRLAGDLTPGETLQIPQPRLALAAAGSTYDVRIDALNGFIDRGIPLSRKTTYVVRSGDTLSKIARKHGVAMRDLARWNHIAPSKALRIGQRLTIQKGVTAPPTAAATAARRNADAGGSKRVNYQVKRGETLSGLARRFGVSVHDIARWNDISPKHELRIGERLTLYPD